MARPHRGGTHLCAAHIIALQVKNHALGTPLPREILLDLPGLTLTLTFDSLIAVGSMLAEEARLQRELYSSIVGVTVNSHPPMALSSSSNGQYKGTSGSYRQKSLSS